MNVFDCVRTRRTIRHFKPDPIPEEVVRKIVQAARWSPSSSNSQPWHFVVISDPEVKGRIRVAAEEEEEAFYGGRAPEEWVEALAPLGTDAYKPFLERAPYLIVIFAESYSVGEDGDRTKNYYVTESVGIATGLLITAIHRAGLVSLTHTPSPMAFLNEVLERPKNERPFLILVVGYPEEDAEVPAITKKSLGEIATFVESRPVDG